MNESKKFTDFAWRPNGKAITYARSSWKAYWESLSPGEQQSLKDKAAYEHMSLSAVAIEWGATEPVVETSGANDITQVTEPPKMERERRGKRLKKTPQREG